METEEIIKIVKFVVNIIFSVVLVWIAILHPQLWIIYGIFVLWYVTTGGW